MNEIDIVIKLRDRAELTTMASDGFLMRRAAQEIDVLRSRINRLLDLVSGMPSDPHPGLGRAGTP
jgi:hypothetical protein